MEIDEFLSSLNSDIDRQLADLGLSDSVPGVVEESGDGQPFFCPECGTRVPMDANFCPNCGYDFRSDGKEQDNGSDPFLDDYNDELNDREDQLLVLLYSGSALAFKYGMDLQEADDAMASLVDAASTQNVAAVCCNIDDWAGPMHTANGPAIDWRVVSDSMGNAIRRIAAENGVNTGPAVLVLIIGGDDCIPMPRFANPSNSGLSELHSDMLYCWDDIYLDFDQHPDNLEICLSFSDIRCCIARLPLEDGRLDTSFEEDITEYFRKAADYQEGIAVRSVAMTSTLSWIPASTAMVDHLPLANMRKVPQNSRLNGMFTSPCLTTDEEESLDAYIDVISQSDMLIFNLHGSDDTDASSYYGQYPNGGMCVEAVDIGTITRTGAPIMNTVACFGARYIGYSREQSMLLSTLYGSPVVLFAGSCSTAFGRSGCDELENMMTPTGFSETFMKLYVLYLFKGIPAGAAFLKAKCDYFNHFSRSEDTPTCLATIMMFNLYGLPSLYIRPRKDVIRSVNGEKEMLVGKAAPKAIPVRVKPLERTVVMLKDDTGSDGPAGILHEVRGAVDAGLTAIRRSIEKNLYAQLHLDPADLTSIERFHEEVDGQLMKGYYFNYDHRHGHVTDSTIAKVDSYGRLLDAIHTK